MSKSKSTLVTVLMSVLLALIFVGLYLLRYRIALNVIAGVFAVIGFFCIAITFFFWIYDESCDVLDLPEVRVSRPDSEPEPESDTLEQIAYTYDQIKKDLEEKA